MTEDSVAVYYDDDLPSDPVVDLDATHEEWGAWRDDEDDDSVSYNDDWVNDIGRGEPPELMQAAVQDRWNEFRSHVISQGLDESSLFDGVEKVYSTSKAAAFFGRSTQWIYWGLRADPVTGQHVFTYKDGTPIQPERVPPQGKRRFTLPIIREIALCCFRRGNFTEDELEAIMKKILLAEFGRRAFVNVD